MKTKKLEAVGYKIELQSQQSVRFLGLWESLHNTQFNYLEFEAIEKESGLNSFVLTLKRWIEVTAAIGITTKQGRYASTFAHKDIAFEFASWISPEFKLYIIKDYQRLKSEESQYKSITWNLNRELAKINYHIHTDTVKSYLIPENVETKVASFVYANEADVLNVALFGKTAKMWKDENPDLKGNIRDYASIEQLIVLINLESMNSELIKTGKFQSERALYLNKMAIEQLTVII